MSFRLKETISTVIEKIDTLEWDHDLYVPPCELKLDSSVAVIKDDGGSSAFENFQYYLSIQDVQSIVENLSVQISKPSASQILEAIKFYYANDAYIQTKS